MATFNPRLDNEYTYDMQQDYVIKNDILPVGMVEVEVIDVEHGRSRKSGKAIVRVTVRYTDKNGVYYDSTQSMSTTPGSGWMYKQFLECLPDAYYLDSNGLTHVTPRKLIGKKLLAECITKRIGDREFTAVKRWLPIENEEIKNEGEGSETADTDADAAEPADSSETE